MPHRFPHIYDLEPDDLTDALRALADAIDAREVDVRAVETGREVRGDDPLERELTLTYIPTSEATEGIADDAVGVKWGADASLGTPDRGEGDPAGPAPEGDGNSWEEHFENIREAEDADIRERGGERE